MATELEDDAAALDGLEINDHMASTLWLRGEDETTGEPRVFARYEPDSDKGWELLIGGEFIPVSDVMEAVGHEIRDAAHRGMHDVPALR